MSEAGDGRGWLIQACPWGEVLVTEPSGTVGARVVEEIALASEDSGAVALAQRWQVDAGGADGASPIDAVPNLAAAKVVASVDRGGSVLRVERLAPRGSTVAELVESHGPLNERQIAALLLELTRGVAARHVDQLAVGALAPSQLYVCPPGTDGRAAVQAFEAGRLAVVCAAGHRLGGPDSAGFDQLCPDLAAVAPELLDGGQPNAASDAWALAATVAFAALGRPFVVAATPLLVAHRSRAGLDEAGRNAITAALPTLGAVVVRALSPSPWLRTGTVGELRGLFERLLGDDAGRLSSKGAGPWSAGSPLVALAVFARNTEWADRHATAGLRRAGRLARNAVGPRTIAPGAGSAGATSTSTAAAGAAHQAPGDKHRLERALVQIDTWRVLQQQDSDVRRAVVLRWLVVIAALIGVALLSLIGAREIERVVAPPITVVWPPNDRPPQPPLEPRVLFEGRAP